jgi:hypothetical protein
LSKEFHQYGAFEFYFWFILSLRLVLCESFSTAKAKKSHKGFKNTLFRLLCLCGAYTVAGRAIGFALEQPLHVAALA